MTASTYKGTIAKHLVENQKQWIDSSVFTQIGGLNGDRRLRELRAEGWSIKSRRNPESPRNFQYTLTRVPAKRVVAQYV